MPKYKIRNNRTGVVLGVVCVRRPDQVLAALAHDTDSSIQDIALSLGRTAEEALAALDIVELEGPPSERATPECEHPLPRRQLFR